MENVCQLKIMYHSNDLVKLANFLQIDTLLIMQTEILSFTSGVLQRQSLCYGALYQEALTLLRSCIHNCIPIRFHIAKILSKISNIILLVNGTSNMVTIDSLKCEYCFLIWQSHKSTFCEETLLMRDENITTQQLKFYNQM